MGKQVQLGSAVASNQRVGNNSVPLHDLLPPPANMRQPYSKNIKNTPAHPPPKNWLSLKHKQTEKLNPACCS